MGLSDVNKLQELFVMDVFSLHDQIWIENNLFHYNQATTAFVKCAKKWMDMGQEFFAQDHIRVEKIKIASLVPNIYEVSLYVILEVHQ